MNDIKPVIFLVPLIVLSIVCMLYFILLKKQTDKKTFNRYILSIIFFAYLLNFAWELIQIPLYKTPMYDTNHIAFCALASLADVLMVLLLYFSFSFIFKDTFWIQDLQLKRALLLIIIGGAGAVLFEMRHLLLGSWEYDNSMPILPFVRVGLSPVLQFMILPLLTYFISYKCLKEQKKNIMVLTGDG